MTGKITGILLALSVGFNLFFLTGYYKASRVVGGHYSLRDQIEIAGDKLGLDRSGKTRLMRVFDETQQRLTKLKTHQKETTHTFWQAFKKPHPDVEHLRSLLDSVKKDQRQTRRFIRQSWQTFLDTLDARQQRAVRTFLKRHPSVYRKLFPGIARGNL